MLKLLDGPDDPQADDLRTALELLRRWTAAKDRLARVAMYDRPCMPAHPIRPCPAYERTP